jgi:hypothetical protein
MGFAYSLYFYRCPFCEVVTQPRRGDCCVFRSYGTVPICLCDPIESQNPRSTH